MFTFGREHERVCAIRYIRKEIDKQLISNVVDAVHDLLEGKALPSTTREAIIEAFVKGGAGVWEQTGAWLRKLSVEYPELEVVWNDLSYHANAKVRFRVACFLNELPLKVACEIGDRLKQDCSQKTQAMATDRMAEISHSKKDAL